MSPNLAPETWLYIFQLLRKPLPAPHTAIRPASTEIRQPDLVAVLKVSKTWHNLAAPLLYRVIVCDSFPLLLHGIDDPAIPGLTPKADLLGHTTRLFIEYEFSAHVSAASKPLHLRPQYEARLGLSEGGDQYERYVRGVEEAQRLLANLDATRSPSGESRLIFSRLRALALDAYGGDDDGRWDYNGYFISTYAPLRSALGNVLVRFVHKHSSTIRQYCERNTDAGPLWLCSAATVGSQGKGRRTTLSYHYHKSIHRGLPVADFHVTRWYLHHHPTSVESHLDDVSNARATIADDLDSWARVALDLGPSYTYPRLPCGGLYLNLGNTDGTTGGFLAAAEIEAQIKSELLLPRVGANVPRRQEPDENWEVKDIAVDAPACGGCGWRVGQ